MLIPLNPGLFMAVHRLNCIIFGVIECRNISMFRLDSETDLSVSDREPFGGCVMLRETLRVFVLSCV